MKEIGPIKHISSLRFESFHSLNKSNIRSSTCRINVTESMSQKYCLQISNLILNFNELICPKISHGVLKSVQLGTIEKYGINYTGAAQSMKFLNIEGRQINVGYCILISKTEVGKIDYIIQYRNLYFLLLSLYDIICFDPHFYAFIVEEKQEYRSILIRNINSYYLTQINIIENYQVININKTLYDYFNQ